jgi:hypothetical protein
VEVALHIRDRDGRTIRSGRGYGAIQRLSDLELGAPGKGGSPARRGRQ